MMRCNNCGWENPAGSQRCEKCNEPFVNQVEVKPQQEPQQEPKQEKPIRRTLPEGFVPVSDSSASPASGADAIEKGTVPPWMQMPISQTRYCKLIPMENMPNEHHVPSEVEFQGDCIELNRSNLEPSNNTISKESQATLFFEEGQWYIEDKSRYETTYIHAVGKTPIKSGDIILMGNRRFKFSEE